MAVGAMKFWNTDDTHYFAEDILNKYYLSVGNENVSDAVVKYIYKIGETCAGMFSEDEVWSMIKVLNENDCLTEEVVIKSNIQKFTRTSSPITNEHIKEELTDLASNKAIKHINKRQPGVKEYKTKCFTIDSKQDYVKIGNLDCVFEYSEDGFGLNQTFNKNEEGFIDFTQNNVLIKIKEDLCDGEYSRHARIIVIKQLEK